jgi:hypothetical protein
MLDLDLVISDPVLIVEPVSKKESAEPKDARKNTIVDTSKQTYITGHCAVGGHEGQPKLSVGGSLMVACRGVYEYPRLAKPIIVCKCWCHALYETMRLSQAQAANGTPNDTPTPQKPADDDSMPLKWHITTPVLADVELPIPGPVRPATQNIYDKLYDDRFLSDHLARMLEKYCGVTPHAVERSYRPAQRERNSLDVNVETVCRMLADEILPKVSTDPAMISLFIDPDAGISAGAVRACIVRMSDEGYMERVTPVHFRGFKGRALEVTIKEARLEVKRAGNRVIRGV